MVPWSAAPWLTLVSSGPLPAETASFSVIDRSSKVRAVRLMVTPGCAASKFLLSCSITAFWPTSV